jgi:hypothetical protein
MQAEPALARPRAGRGRRGVRLADPADRDRHHAILVEQDLGRAMRIADRVVGERAELAVNLLASLVGEQEANVEAAWASEIERRAREALANPDDDLSWESVRVELHAASRARWSGGGPPRLASRRLQAQDAKRRSCQPHGAAGRANPGVNCTISPPS